MRTPPARGPLACRALPSCPIHMHTTRRPVIPRAGRISVDAPRRQRLTRFGPSAVGSNPKDRLASDFGGRTRRRAPIRASGDNPAQTVRRQCLGPLLEPRTPLGIGPHCARASSSLPRCGGGGAQGGGGSRRAHIGCLAHPPRHNVNPCVPRGGDGGGGGCCVLWGKGRVSPLDLGLPLLPAHSRTWKRPLSRDAPTGGGGASTDTDPGRRARRGRGSRLMSRGSTSPVGCVGRGCRADLDVGLWPTYTLPSPTLPWGEVSAH